MKMAGTNISSVWKMLFLLFPASIFVSGECLKSLYQLLPNGYNVYVQDGTQAEFKSFKSNTILKCASHCMSQEFCHVWRIDNGYCHIFHSLLDKVTVNATTDPNQLTYYLSKEVSNWIEVYFLKAKSKFNASASFLGQGTYKSWGPASCTQNFCKDLFRSLLIDIWAYLPIKQAKLSLFKNGTKVLSLVFDAQGTDSQSWFDLSHVQKSPWKDVYNGSTNSYFEINAFFARSFYIREGYKGCVSDYGWLAVIERKHQCAWETHSAYPYIIYSGKDRSTHWQAEYAFADALAVYISI